MTEQRKDERVWTIYHEGETYPENAVVTGPPTEGEIEVVPLSRLQKVERTCQGLMDLNDRTEQRVAELERERDTALDALREIARPGKIHGLHEHYARKIATAALQPTPAEPGEGEGWYLEICERCGFRVEGCECDGDPDRKWIKVRRWSAEPGEGYRIAEREGGKAWAIEWRDSPHESWDTLPFRFLDRGDAEAKMQELSARRSDNG